MMMTDLKVTDLALQRPRLNRIVVRSITYVLSVAGLGAGLLWGCFDRHSRCLHDRLSGTRVVRLAF
jgi:hypothetical protein